LAIEIEIGLKSLSQVEQQSVRPHTPMPPSSAASSRAPDLHHLHLAEKRCASSRTSWRKSTRASEVK
jgi:hypothetical protein